MRRVYARRHFTSGNHMDTQSSSENMRAGFDTSLLRGRNSQLSDPLYLGVE